MENTNDDMTRANSSVAGLSNPPRLMSGYVKTYVFQKSSYCGMCCCYLLLSVAVICCCIGCYLLLSATVICCCVGCCLLLSAPSSDHIDDSNELTLWTRLENSSKRFLISDP